MREKERWRRLVAWVRGACSGQNNLCEKQWIHSKSARELRQTQVIPRPSARSTKTLSARLASSIMLKTRINQFINNKVTTRPPPPIQLLQQLQPPSSGQSHEKNLKITHGKSHASDLFTADFEINDVRIAARNILTKVRLGVRTLRGSAAVAWGWVSDRISARWSTCVQGWTGFRWWSTFLNLGATAIVECALIGMLGGMLGSNSTEKILIWTERAAVLLQNR